MTPRELEAKLHALLQPELHPDACPNGLQVENDGRPIKKLALAVSVSLEVIQAAAAWGADALLTHHGLFWQGANPCLLGPQRTKVKALLERNMALLSYHLPLDKHPMLGNNAQLGLRLGLGPGLPWGPQQAGLLFSVELTAQELHRRATALLGREPQHLNFGPPVITRIALVSGGGQKYFSTALGEGIHCFLTGEAGEPNYAEAQEAQAHLFALGHYASEQFGVQALGDWLQPEVECRFIQTQNPL